MNDDAADTQEPPGHRLTRAARDTGRSIAGRIGARMQQLSYGSVLHRRALRGRQPLKILGTPSDPVRGDMGIGRAIASGTLRYAGHEEAIRLLKFSAVSAPRRWREWAHGFGWLRDLAAVADRKKGSIPAELVVEAWLADHGEYDDLAWRPDILGRRILFWTLYAPYILSRGEPIYRSLVLNHLARGARHLDRAYDKADPGFARIEAVGGMLAAGLMLPDGATRTVRAEAALQSAIEAFVFADGGVVSRRPSDILIVAETLLALRALYEARRIDTPEAITQTLDTLASGLKGASLGDGALAAIHGGNVCAAARVAHVLSLIGGAARPTRNGNASGFQRLSAGNSIIVADAGPPPAARMMCGGHAGTLAFEMSDGATRLIVNCGGGFGAPQPLSPKLTQLMRSTAAHSTLVIADTNSTQLNPGGGLGKGVDEVVVTRHESEEGSWLDASHDGYAKRFGLLHRRRIFLSGDGRDLRGEDVLSPVRGRGLGLRRRALRFDIRFHLGPGAEATPTADGKGALVKLPTGHVWQVKVRGGALDVDESLWIDAEGQLRPIMQLVVTGETVRRADTAINWSFKRSGR